MSTEQRETLDAILRQSAFPVGSGVDEQRRLLRELVSAQPLPADVTVTAAALGGVPTAEITVDGIEPRHVVLYFHGGVYVIGDAFLAAELASQVGRRTQAKVISVDYRLAPEHPYPAAVDDALAAYEALLQTGIAPSDIVFAGESAGGGLAIATLVNARDHGLPLPAAAFVMSPYVDLTLAGTTMETKRDVDPLLSRELLQARVADYTAGQDAALWPHQPAIRRPVRPAAPDHPGRNSRGAPRRCRPPRGTSRHRRRRGHARHHSWGAPRLPGLSRDPRRSGRGAGPSRPVPVGAPRRCTARQRRGNGRTHALLITQDVDELPERLAARASWPVTRARKVWLDGHVVGVDRRGDGPWRRPPRDPPRPGRRRVGPVRPR